MNTDAIEQSADSLRPRAKPSAAKSWLKAIELTSRIEANPSRLFADVVEDWAARQPDRAALISQAETFSYRTLAERINRYARWALAAGIEPGDTVCLLLPSRPDYIAAWLGISKVGGVAALINTRLVGLSLSHCINVADADHVILAGDLAGVFETALPYLNRAPKIWIHGRGGEASIDPMLDGIDGSPLSPAERRAVTISDRALLIYTSGTTGLPKAASVSHRRILNWGGWFAGLTNASPEDRLYDCLPLFHSVGGIVAPCSMLTAGASVVLAEKFSASQFWSDIVRWDCTLFQYIGELCRYLLKAPVSELENRHRLRLACGNGLRGDIWEAFQARFAIPRILEFYAATEGNFSLYNVEGRPGAIGRIPPLLAHRFPAAIVRLDAELGVPVRAENGLCIPCARGEIGEAIGRIGTADDGGGRFEGYTDKDETEKKILRDVLAPGDAWFRTGDLMRLDESGFFHFVDRVGDTFRWKGENVATSEVNEAILDGPDVIDATTYGVEIPGADGRAGMAAIVAGDRFDLTEFRNHLSRRLPAYAHPVFVRISAALETTETFKQKKQQLSREGFDPRLVTDPLFLRDPESGVYLPIGAADYARIVDGRVRL
ncbi:long-chain-acyl-CoA synthetase [Bradyrhizobium erythrophlei]|jgi:fatty-acyl-CoA synthase|uniref:Fatty-acyl-CoA synthase n=1 Tax=Bradyrhizobium erythrophlei TaxID=1437360 RepID=A0A1M5X7H8_9BRAD|nr:long-chain-acyl-CoA synthetase [Bradyrhizobium erythrophlei]SHH95787.1 fatty-acyl-CoA synthase [Bradyrhizobium erythrophlei]